MPPLPLDGAFTALLLLITGASAGSVLPPANVSASCSGLNVTVRWEYSTQRPQTSFRVLIIGSEGKYESVTTEHQYDLSHFVWASERHALDFYSVNVTAVEGGNKSEPVGSESFSFNWLKTATIKCKLDFPPVDLTDTDSGATVSFMNPLHFYGALKRLDTGTLTFKPSSSDARDFDGSCTAQDINCKHNVVFPKDEEKCLSLTGRLGAKNEYGGFEFRETGRICAVASSVRLPANVSASCSGLNVTVRWEYSTQRPQTSFRVLIIGSEGKYESVTTEHQYDLSHFVWASERHALDFYSVNVTAVEGGNKSKQVASKSFSFNRLKPAKIKCKLDFPPVDLTDTDSGATVSFMNPLHFYGALKRLDTGTLTFKSSSSDASGFDGSCTAQDINCKLDVRFPKDEEKCLSLTGRLGAKNEYGGFEFRETGRICAVASSELHVVTLTVSLFVLAIVCSVIAIIVCKVKAWTLKTPDPPQTLTSQLQNRKEGGKYAPVSPADISPLTFAPYKKPSISSEEDDRELAEYPRGGGAPGDFQPPAGPYAEGGLSDGYRRGDESGDDSQKTETISMDSEEDVSPYDRPHTLQVDMGDGDVVTGYSER